MLSQNSFYQFVREERLFCATLAHLLMQKGPNIARFFELVSARLPDARRMTAADLGKAEIYVEFSFPRDEWHKIGRDNEKKRARIMDLLNRVPNMQQRTLAEIPEPTSNFNQFFMGPRGLRTRRDISSPGNWSVVTLSEKFGQHPEQFREVCKLKWSFKIKPDIVIVIPCSRPLCIEAKLESKEGSYPTGNRERQKFDELFGMRNGRVGQFELQKFMFSALLDDPCDFLFIGRNPGPGAHLTWQEVFQNLDLDASIEFVSRLIKENNYLKPK